MNSSATNLALSAAHSGAVTTRAPLLSVDRLSVKFGPTIVLDGLSLDVARGEVVCLLGPSGSGKSTLLRCIAGIDRPSAGTICIEGVEVTGKNEFLEPERRRVGMVFQDYALFPHLTIKANVAFGLSGNQGSKHITVAHLLQRLGLEKFADSYPHSLSGGERQRVALARAIAPMPQILLMDEPFSSLDSRLRDDVRRQTLVFLRESQITTIIVTHDPAEALRIGDRIALIDHGRLVQSGTPEDLYQRPCSLFAARFFSDVTPLPGICKAGWVTTAIGSFPAPELAEGTAALVCLRPEQVRIVAGSPGIAALVIGTEFRGDRRYLLAQVAGVEAALVVSVPQQDLANATAPESGMTIFLEISGTDIPVVAADPNLQSQQGANSHVR